MEGIRKAFYYITGLLGLLMAGATILVVLIQCRTEIDPILILFCAVSWILFFCADYETSRLRD